MKTRKTIWAIVTFLIFLSCGQSEKESKGINKVTVAFSGLGCDSECPSEILSIDSTLTLCFYGGMFQKKAVISKG